MAGSSVRHHAGGTTEDLSAQLAQRCPAYFKEDDKIFYEASGLMQRAEAATAAAEKDHLTRSALKLMMKVGVASLYSYRENLETEAACVECWAAVEQSSEALTLQSKCCPKQHMAGRLQC